MSGDNEKAKLQAELDKLTARATSLAEEKRKAEMLVDSLEFQYEQVSKKAANVLAQLEGMPPGRKLSDETIEELYVKFVEDREPTRGCHAQKEVARVLVNEAGPMDVANFFSQLLLEHDTENGRKWSFFLLALMDEESDD